MRSVHKQRVAREATGGHRLRIRRTGGELAGKACSRSSTGRITSLSHFLHFFSRRAPSKRKSAEQNKRLRSAGATSAAGKVASANQRKRRQAASSQGVSRAAELKPPSHAFSGAGPGTHPAACKRPWERPRRGAAKPQSPAPRPNRPPGKKMHASPDRGGREASNEPL